jgi:hypothetical protein
MREVTEARALQALAVRRPLDLGELEHALRLLAILVEKRESAPASWLYNAVLRTFKKAKSRGDGSHRGMRLILERAASLMADLGSVQRSHRIEPLPRRPPERERSAKSIRRSLKSLFPDPQGGGILSP